MSKTTILTPDNIEVEYTLASLPLRAAAAGIDMIIQLLIFAVFVIIGIFAIDIETISVDMPKKEFTILAVLLIVYGLLMYGYYVILDVYMKGQTVGKRLYHIRVIRENGEGINLVHAIIREFLRITIDTYGIGIIMVFFNKKYKRLGDIMASTIVVSEGSRQNRYEGYRPMENPYHIEKDDIDLVKNLLDRYDEINYYEQQLLEERLIKYISDKYKVEKGTMERREYLKSLIVRK